MTRAISALAATCILSLAGCTAMCQSPWDYCNAVLDGSGTPNCNFGARYNSAFAPMNGTPSTTPVEPTPAEGEPAEPEQEPAVSEEPGEISDNYLDPLPE